MIMTNTPKHPGDNGYLDPSTEPVRVIRALDDEPFYDGDLLIAAANGDHKKIIDFKGRMLRSDMEDALPYAIFNGHSKCVEALLPEAFDGMYGSSGNKNLKLIDKLLEAGLSHEFKFLLKLMKEPALEHSLARTAKWGRQDLLAEVIKLSEGMNTRDALYDAAAGDHKECVATLLDLSCDKTAIFSAMRVASKNGSVNCLGLLMEAAPEDSQDDFMDCLVLSAEGGHRACVDLLIPASGDQPLASKALISAGENGNRECVESLAHISDIQKAAEHFISLGDLRVIEWLSPHLDTQLLYRALNQNLPKIMARLQEDWLNTGTNASFNKKSIPPPRI